MKSLIVCYTVLILSFSVYAKVIDDFEDISAWKVDTHDNAKLKLSKVPGKMGGSLMFEYDFNNKNWVQASKPFKIQLQSNDVIKVAYKVSTAGNSIEIKLEDSDKSVFGNTFKIEKTGNDYKYMEIAVSELRHYWGGDDELNLNNLKKIYFVIQKKTDEKGWLKLDDLSVVKTGRKSKYKPADPLPKYYKLQKPLIKERTKAAEWIASMQNDNGFVTSYIGDAKAFAWTYDQSLALIVFAHEFPERARKLLDALKKSQNEDGSWYDGYLGPSGEAVTDNKWVGSVAWVIHSICRYSDITGDKSYMDTAKKAVDWLAHLQTEAPEKDGRVHLVTEGNLDCWWAFKDMGYEKEAKHLEKFIIEKNWLPTEGRMLASPENYDDLYFDPHSWGSAFFRFAGYPDTGLIALGMAKRELRTKTLDTNYTGFDTKGPYTMWNEATAQWITCGGDEPDFYNNEIARQQHKDGSLQHSHEGYFRGKPSWEIGGTWHTTMKSVASTAWFYFANADEPWHLSR